LPRALPFFGTARFLETAFLGGAFFFCAGLFFKTFFAFTGLFFFFFFGGIPRFYHGDFGDRQRNFSGDLPFDFVRIVDNPGSALATLRHPALLPHDLSPRNSGMAG
jgi:hypothetical protein